MTKSSISIAFKKSKKEKRPALLTYTVAGDNTKKKSLEILNYQEQLYRLNLFLNMQTYVNWDFRITLQ